MMINVLLSLFFWINLPTQANKLDIKIANDTIVISKNDAHMAIEIRCKNNGKKNLLLYGIESNLLVNADKERLCNVNLVGGGLGMLLLDEKNSRVYAIEELPDSIDYKPSTRETFKRQMEEAKARFISGTRVAKVTETLEFRKKINMRQFALRPGKYYLQIVYYSGAGLKDNFVVGEKQIEKDMILHDAEIYQGCSISNQIVVTVI